jgi:hypothetical protein
MGIWEVFAEHRGRPIRKVRHYFPVYQRHFGHLVGQAPTFLEIGCGHGGSVAMWREWFGPDSTIIGIDINEQARAYADDGIHIRIGDQADSQFLESVVEEFGPPDGVLDDGSHVMSDIAASFECLYPRLAPTGVYIVEDLRTAYLEQYGGGLGRDGTFIEIAKALIDHLNALNVPRQMPPNDFAPTTTSISFYPSMIALERGPNPPQERVTPAGVQRSARRGSDEGGPVTAAERRRRRRASRLKRSQKS